MKTDFQKEKKRCFLVFKKDLYFYRYCKNRQYRCDQIFTHYRLGFFVAHVLKKMNLKIPKILLGEWKKEIRKFDTIVISDYAYFPGLEKIISNVNPNCRIVFYYMNSIKYIKERYLEIDYIKSLFGKNIYSYNQTDANKYNIYFKTTMYKLPAKLNLEQNVFTDFVYLGRDKNRGNGISEFNDMVCKKYSVNIKILDYHGKLGCKKFVDYEKYIFNMLLSAKVIIDMIEEPSECVTLRALEALFFNKKYLTNNIKIKELEIYNLLKENTLFIDYKRINLDEIDDFMNKKTKMIDSKEKEKYIFENWLKNI
ncbi:hypothetical protein EBB54_20145 [Schaedlerella arabinosiphila]|uniref:Lipopolysaccharide biosynthesis protein n=1 Tax=Schaedlerella arabinosiphila TaxID=2044587 RepID=A0A3R8JQA1_9FIRM|nr:hypothetical protein [Schaedlerella arabinosiphila]RRK33398.1 hypothetical protein EBB54_20145 [Schaedlerella arabinosiphila]